MDAMSMWQMDADLKLHPRSESPKSYSSSVLEIDCKLVHGWLCLLARYAWANVSCQEVGAAPEKRSGLVVVGAPNFRGDAVVGHHWGPNHWHLSSAWNYLMYVWVAVALQQASDTHTKEESYFHVLGKEGVQRLVGNSEMLREWAT